MTPEKEAEEFLKNSSLMEIYREAIVGLHRCGFERLLRRLGEPMSIPSEHPQVMVMSAIDQAEARGWYDAIDYLFNFQERVKVKTEEIGSGDFGAVGRLRGLGFSDKEIAEAEE